MFTRVTQGIILHGLFNAGKFHTTFKLDRRLPLSKKKKNAVYVSDKPVTFKQGQGQLTWYESI